VLISLQECILLQVLQYNMTGGKRNRGLAVLQSYRLLAKNQNPSREELHLVTIMGWCLEMVQIQTTVFDDSFFCLRCGNFQTGSAISAFPSHMLQLCSAVHVPIRNTQRMQNLTCDVRRDGM